MTKIFTHYNMIRIHTHFINPLKFIQKIEKAKGLSHLRRSANSLFLGKVVMLELKLLAGISSMNTSMLLLQDFPKD